MSTTELLDYFTAEKHGAVLIACLGVASAILGSYLYALVIEASHGMSSA